MARIARGRGSRTRMREAIFVQLPLLFSLLFHWGSDPLTHARVRAQILHKFQNLSIRKKTSVVIYLLLPMDLITMILLWLPVKSVMRIKCFCNSWRSLNESPNQHHLPIDLIIEILSWLLVKSLMRFKCVCKSWRSLTESSNFISCHFKKTNNVNILLMRYGIPYNLKSFFTNPFHDPQRVFLLSSYETLDFTASAKLKFTYFDRVSSRYLRFVGSCNGVICATNLPHNDFALWNPATREVKVVQFPHKDDKLVYHGYFGFGFDPKTNDYKVVRVRSIEPSITEVYNLRTDSWRRIEAVVPADHFILVNYSLLTPFVNGKVSWLAYELKRNAAVLLSFDISDEFFLTTPCPDAFGMLLGQTYRFRLMVLNELVAVIIHRNPRTDHHNYNVSAFDLWVLNEYGRKESWVKLYTIGPLSTIFFDPLGFWKNGEWFLHTMDGHLALFNPISLETEDIQLDDGILKSKSVRVVVYKESLVRLN